MQLQQLGRGAEADKALGILEDLGLPKAEIEKLRAQGRKPAPKSGAPKLPAIAKELRRVAASLAKAAAPRPDEERLALDRIALRLDGACAEARKALGFELVDGEWLDADGKARRARVADIRRAFQDARRLDVPLRISESRDPLLVKILGHSGTAIEAGKFRVHAAWTPEKAARIVREGLRACALSSYLVDGKLEVPANLEGVAVWVDTKDLYDKAIDAALESKLIAESKVAEFRALSSFRAGKGLTVEFDVTEAQAEAMVLSRYGTAVRDTQFAVAAGHTNFVCLGYLGTSIPSFVWTERTGGVGRKRSETGVDPQAERKEMLRLSTAGLAGCRAWMAWLAARREDPPWERCRVEQIGKIGGDDLLKATTVAEMLQERGPLRPLLKLLGPQRAGDAPASVPTFENVLGEPLAKFEERWRAWIVRESGIAERLDAAETAASNVEKEALAALGEVRGVALAGRTSEVANHDVQIEPSLSRGARLHAEYLALHPEQTKAWPDAHEEWPDREGFTPEGAWAGGHSVIVPGSASARRAIDAWMGTFYHRLPLLEPGLMRIGFALEKGVAVLDAGSLNAPIRVAWSVAWPADGATGVPTRFSSPELPHPVPGEDQSKWGYPITLQLGPRDSQVEVHMALRRGGPDGPEIPCWLSTPTKPTNPELAPADAWCLIPKAPLERGTSYHVQADLSGEAALLWKFKTE